MITASEKNGLKGRSVRTISHARTDPIRIAKNDTQTPISSELSSGWSSICLVSALPSRRCQYYSVNDPAVPPASRASFCASVNEVEIISSRGKTIK